MNRVQILLLLIIALLLCGCRAQAAADEQDAPVVAMASVGGVEETAVSPTTAITSTTTVTDTQTAITPTPETIDECLVCHLDKDLLIETAAPVEEVVVESDGEG